jgi:hypothetical protein
VDDSGLTGVRKRQKYVADVLRNLLVEEKR